MTLEQQKHIRQKCRYCKCYLPKECLNDICLKCSFRKVRINIAFV